MLRRIGYNSLRLRAVTLAAAATVILAACGSSATVTTSSAPASAAKPAASTSPAVSAASAKPSGAAASAKPAASSAAKPAANSAGASASGQATTLNVSYSAVVPMSLPVWVANDDGFFKKNGLDVKLTYIESAKGIPAVISGEIQIGNLGGPETMSAVAGGADLVTVSCESPTYPFVMQAVPGINSMQELKGKKVGVSTFGSVSDIAARISLEKNGLDPSKDVSLIQVGSASNRLAALKSGAIQAGASFPPDSYTLEAQGFKTIYDLGAQHVPGSTGTDIMSRTWMNANKPVVQKYVDSIVEALANIKKDKANAAQVLGKYMKSNDTANLNKTIDYFVQNVYPTYPDTKPDQYTEAQKILGGLNAKVKGFDVSKMLDDSFVQNAQSRGLANK